jgi:hypothetical protein
MKRVQATIPVPYENIASLTRTAIATKELVEALAGQTGAPADIAVTWQDLLNLGLIKPEQVPKGLGSDRF